ncbi:unnamed protein product [Tetraodon nigroviridis]|uniref:(spotted green pufferfish) hypothetical protein n=1 Tax=Tetraodon nigroviridis TaxID=99883 RepID=Q4RMV2_TETNG|nr:unnamed protein product [Tetraodon nigroviridis]
MERQMPSGQKPTGTPLLRRAVADAPQDHALMAARKSMSGRSGGLDTPKRKRSPWLRRPGLGLINIPLSFQPFRLTAVLQQPGSFRMSVGVSWSSSPGTFRFSSELLGSSSGTAAAFSPHQHAVSTSTPPASTASSQGRDRGPGAHAAGNVKEEAFCCLYQDGSNKGKQTAAPAAYIRLGDNGRGPEQTATQARGCFQMYNRGEPLLDDQRLPSACSLLHLGTSVESEPTISCSKIAKEITKDERRDEKARSDGCSEISDNEELKGRALESQHLLKPKYNKCDVSVVTENRAYFICCAESVGHSAA